MKKRKVCMITGSRADYDLIKFLMQKIKQDKRFSLKIIVTGSHLSKNYGYTVNRIKSDGFNNYKSIPILPIKESAITIAAATSKGLNSFFKFFYKVKPDLNIIFGDRYEMLSAAIASLYLNIPIAHISGGEQTIGSFDDQIRHCITKMSWWHFVSTAKYKKRVIQLGENPKRVFLTGSLGVDNIKRIKLFNKKKLQKELSINLNKKNILVTYHPVTLDKKDPKKEFEQLIKSISLLKDTNFFFTNPNADPNNAVITKKIKNFVRKNKKKAFYFKSLGQQKYFSLLQFVDAVLGNSSSGIIEVPSFKIGTINIGDRQMGRYKPKSIIDCKPLKNDISKSFKVLYSNKFKKKIKRLRNDYEYNNTLEKIFNIIKYGKLPSNIKKSFFDL